MVVSCLVRIVTGYLQIIYVIIIMDRTLNASLLSTRSPFSPKGRPNISLKKSTLQSSFKKSSRLSVSGKSVQSIQIILKTPYNSLERFGQPLPVLITEALTFADRNATVTARISECGYAWIVCGRRLLVWQYKQSNIQYGTPQKKTPSSNCFELQLPQSDLAHRAELVSVYLPSGLGMPACIAVSPGGVVRYWPAITHEGVSVEQNVDLQGQECDSLTVIGNMGCILATTTCTVVHVQPQKIGGRHSLHCKMLKSPSGWFDGISRRMTSFIFGSMSMEHSAEARLVRVLTVPESEEIWKVYVLAGHSLQKWELMSNEQEQLIFIIELNRLIADNFHNSIWENCGGDQSETDTWLLDIQPDKDGIIILAAAVNMHISPQVHYALVSLETNGPEAPNHVRDFYILKMKGLYREDNPQDSLSYRFLKCSSCAYIYNQRCITVIKPQEEPDTLEFNGQDFLLGGSVCINTPVFFSRNHGLIAITSNEINLDMSSGNIFQSNTFLDTSLNETLVGNLTLYSFDPEEMYNSYKDIVCQLKAAFIFHVKNQHMACQDILQKLFFSEGTSIPGVDSTLDNCVITVCEDLLDDIPAGDPRWSGENQAGLGSSYSMQILNQLEDKQKAYGLFIKFLRETNLWNKLAAVKKRDTIMATTHVLGELAEKLTVAIALKSSEAGPILDYAIEKAVGGPNVEHLDGLTNQDVFYREVNKIHRGLQELVNRCEDAAHSDLDPGEVAVLICETNDLLLNVLRELLENRRQNINNFLPSFDTRSLGCEYLPWLAAPGRNGLYDSLMLQQLLTLNYGAKASSDINLKNILYDQFVELVDVILDGQKAYIESINDEEADSAVKQYHSDRHKLIKPLVEDKQWERALLLAEKYSDFETLVEVCEATDNQQRLDEYMERFGAEKFPEYLYNWYLQQNKQGKLINRCKTLSKTKVSQQLTSLLCEHPSLSWLQHIFDQKFTRASEALKNLAVQETESIMRQKTMLSLGKLSRLAAPENSGTTAYLEEVNTRLELVAFQEEIPDYVLQQFGYDTLKPRVIPPKDLVYLFTCSEYKEASEVEFKKALDILVYILDDDERNELWLMVWRRVVLRDTWFDGSLESPMEFLRNTLFYRLAELAIVLGEDPQNLLPPLDTLMDCEEMEQMQDNKNFQFLIKLGYERIQKLQAED
ncbi:nuclear pore complex protein Nup133 [Agrilus planipennis]|uniref:Nuclear pore complex protein Nup133 n=1 Tax=Agrilus planipennis TaxID=224129 RepID=A0A7F5R4A4_AGRPL|nr:nuclear pore complex protein Nup133 [Agrilus planipennis]